MPPFSHRWLFWDYTQANLTYSDQNDFTREGLSEEDIELLQWTNTGLFATNYDQSIHSVDNLADSVQNAFTQSFVLKLRTMERVYNGEAVVGVNYDPDVWNDIDDSTGLYPGVWVLGPDPETGERKQYITFEETRDMFETTGSVGHKTRSLNSDRLLSVVADELGYNVTPLSEITSADYDKWFYNHRDFTSGSSPVAFGFERMVTWPVARNADGSIMVLPDGSGRQINMVNILSYIDEKYVVPGNTPEAAFVLGSTGLGMRIFTHTGRTSDIDPLIQTYGDISQIPLTPTGAEVFAKAVAGSPRSGIGGSLTFASWFEGLYQVAGMRSSHSFTDGNTRLLTVVIDDKEFHADGNDLPKRLSNKIDPCEAFADSIEQVETITLNDAERYSPSLCDFVN